MAGATSGFIQLFIKEIKQFHSIIHQEALCTKDSSRKLDKILKGVAKMVNFIMARA